MNTLATRTRSAVVGLAAVAVMSALLASSAMAASSTWSTTGAAKMTTTSVVVKKNGANPITCTPNASPLGNVFNSGGVGGGTFYTGAFSFSYNFTCPSGAAFAMYLVVAPEANGATKTLRIQPAPGAGVPTPYGAMMYQDVMNLVVPFTNGAGATPSTTTFNNTVVGHISPTEAVSLTGTFNVTTSAGGLLKIN